MDLAEQIKTARDTAKLTQAELAAKAGVSPRTITNIEAGNTPNPLNLAAVCRALGIPHGDPIPPDAPLKDRVRVHRTNAGLTQARLAELSGIYVRTIQNVEAGEDATPRTINALEHALGVHLIDHGTDTPTAALPDLIDKRMNLLGIESSRGLASRAGVSPTTVTRTRRGEHLPETAVLRKLAVALADDDTPSTTLYRQLHEAAYGRQKVTYVPPAIADELTAKNRGLLNDLIRIMVLSQRAGADDNGPGTEAPGPVEQRDED